MREKTMRALMCSAIPIAAFVMVLFAWAMYQGLMRRTSTGVRIRVARDTCACPSDTGRIVVLHVLSDGALRINFEDVTRRELGARLKEIYETRAERMIYLTAEPDAPFEDVADVSGIAQKYVDNIMLITPRAMDTPCCERGCHDFTHPMFVPLATDKPASPNSKTDIEKELANSDQVPPCPEPAQFIPIKRPSPAELQ